MKIHQTRSLRIGSVKIGGDAPVVVQSMTNTDTRDSETTLQQIHALATAGCELVRVAVPDKKAAAALKEICSHATLPVIADVHFDANLAVLALENGVNALRINPGNLEGGSKVDRVAAAAKMHQAPIRIGVNSGSLPKDLLEKYQGPTPKAMVESALRHIQMLEDRGFDSIKVSLKSSSVLPTIAAYKEFAKVCDYPLHIGITEAGTLLRGAIKSSVGLGILLYEGLGNTLRVSLTNDPVKEIEAAWQILASLGLRQRGPEIISCPTCGRTEIDLIRLAEAVEEKLLGTKEIFTVAVMGCVVNGPGEAKEADIGIAGGKEKGTIFRKGNIVRSVSGGHEVLLEALMDEIAVFLQEKNSV